MNLKEVIKKEIQAQVLVGTGDDTIYPDSTMKKQKYIEVIDIDKLVNILVRIIDMSDININDLMDL